MVAWPVETLVGVIDIWVLLFAREFSMSMRNKLIKARSYQRPQNRCGSITLFIVAIGSLAIASIFLFGTLLTDVKKSINIRGFTGSPTDQVDIVTELIVEPTMANPLVKSPLEPFSKKNGSYDIHFIHIPKCGGTSMTSILREVACTIDPSRNNDCCTNPGA